MRFFIAPPAPVSVPVTGGGELPLHRICCVGRNDAEHAQAMGFTGREPPFFFLKPADTHASRRGAAVRGDPMEGAIGDLDPLKGALR